MTRGIEKTTMDDVLMRGIEEGNIFGVIFFLFTLIGIVWLLGCIIVAPFTKGKDDS